MQMPNTNAADAAVIGATEETLDSLKAIKGEAFTECVLMGVNVKSLMSMNALLYSLIDESNEQARDMAMMASIITSQMVSKLLALLAEKAGVDNAAEIIEWVERIHDNAQRIGNNALKTPPMPDTLQ